MRQDRRRAARAKRIRFHALGELTQRVPGPPGSARTAVAPDRDLLVRWSREMDAEVGEPSPGDGIVAEAITHGLRTLWLTPEGEPVAMAGRTLEASGARATVPGRPCPDRRAWPVKIVSWRSL